MSVWQDDLERSLAAVEASAAGADEGVFGPASVVWRISREAAIFLCAGRALLLQLAHPWVAAAIAEHSRTVDDPVGRFHRTFQGVFTMVFGTRDQALAASRRLHRRHAAITGAVPHTVGPFPRGSPYFANDAPALQWVHATLVDSAAVAYDLVLPPLGAAARERFWAEARVFAALFGIPPAGLPADWSGFARYTEAMIRSDVLTVGPSARDIARRLFTDPARGPRPPAWYRALTAQLLPVRLRAGFGLADDPRERRRAARALWWIRRVYPLLPDRIRTVGPYQEARARLRGGASPDLMTRWLSRLWTGRPRMAEGAHGETRSP